MTTTIDVTGLPPVFVQKLIADVAEERERLEKSPPMLLSPREKAERLRAMFARHQVPYVELDLRRESIYKSVRE